MCRCYLHCLILPVFQPFFVIGIFIVIFIVLSDIVFVFVFCLFFVYILFDYHSMQLFSSLSYSTCWRATCSVDICISLFDFWPLGSRLWYQNRKLSLSHWCSGSGEVLDCIDSWSLPVFLLCLSIVRCHCYLHCLCLLPWLSSWQLQTFSIAPITPTKTQSNDWRDGQLLDILILSL